MFRTKLIDYFVLLFSEVRLHCTVTERHNNKNRFTLTRDRERIGRKKHRHVNWCCETTSGEKEGRRERERQRLRSEWIDRVRLICIMRWLLWTTRQPISFVINVIPTRVGKEEEEEEEEEEVQPKWKALFISFSSLSLRRVSRAGETRASLFSSLSPFCWHCEWLFHLKGKRDWVLLLSLNLSLGPIGKKSQMKNSICLISWGSTVCVYTQYDAGHTTTTAPKRL